MSALREQAAIPILRMVRCRMLPQISDRVNSEGVHVAAVAAITLVGTTLAELERDIKAGEYNACELLKWSGDGFEELRNVAQALQSNLDVLDEPVAARGLDTATQAYLDCKRGLSRLRELLR